MGRASSSKKVARAAGISGSRAYRRQRPWGYFGIIALIIALGVAGTVASRDRRIAQINNAGTTAPTVGTTWHEGYAIYACGSFLEPPASGKPDPIKVPSAHDHGIETQVQGVILISPQTKAVAGHNATLGKFASTVGMKLNAAELQLPGGKLYQNGDPCEGSQGHVYVREFNGTSDKTGTLYDGKSFLPKLDPANVPLKDDDLLTIAFVPSSKAATIPPPPQAVYTAIAGYQAQEQASSTSTTLPTLTVPPTSPPTTAKK